MPANSPVRHGRSRQETSRTTRSAGRPLGWRRCPLHTGMRPVSNAGLRAPCETLLVETGRMMHTFLLTITQWGWQSNNHSTTSVSGSVEQWNSGVHNTGFTFDHTFTHAGTFVYYCTTHGQDNG